jgi:hypothetical protein
MTTAAPRSFQHKLRWASKLLEQFESDTADWFHDKKHYSFSVEQDPADRNFYFFKLSVDPIPIDPFSLLIGDIVQNLRSGLDHLAYELALSHTKLLTATDAKTSQFPIIGDESFQGIPGSGQTTWTSRALPGQIRSIHPAAQKIMQGVQPFVLGGEFRSHPLWWLAELSNIDKHRSLHIGVVVIGAIFCMDERMHSGQIIESSEIFESGNVIARVSFNPPYEREIDIINAIEPDLSMAFGHDPVRNSAAFYVLRRMLDYINYEVVRPLLAYI